MKETGVPPLFTSANLRIAYEIAKDLITHQSPEDIARMQMKREKRTERRAKIKTLVTFPKRSHK